MLKNSSNKLGTFNENRVTFKAVLLSISLLTGSATAITGMLPILLKQFPQLPQSTIESLVTIPSLTTCIFSLLSNQITKKFGVKRTVQLGIVIATSAGIMPFFLKSFVLIFFCRLFLGGGIGLFTPLAISLISMFFTGKDRAVLLGYQVGISALGNSALLLVSGSLISIKWNWGFLVYLLALPILLVFTKVVPEPSAGLTAQKKADATSNKRLSNSVLLYILLCFFTFLIIWAVQIKLPELFMEKNFGNAQSASLVLSIMNLGGLLAGLLFGRLFIYWRERLLPISYLAAGALVILLSFSQQFIVSAIAAVLFNFVYSFTGPYIITKVNELSPPHQLILATALISVSMTLSQFATPFFWNGLGALVNNQTAESIIFLAGLSAVLIGILLILKLKIGRNKKN
ncbi:MFS transporter [Enterococcus sp. AZ072]|uniref:MFS transporter n=1 Tax=unclassified Enterococcus TaxID=2608891 RepID=UPI003D2E122B